MAGRGGAGRLLTVGVYGFSEEAFFGALVGAGVDLVCDVRARRGVRGAEYAFANAGRLSERLEELGIGYVHAKGLAPSDAMRRRQYEDDAAEGKGQRSREVLGRAFVGSYRREVLEGFDAAAFLREILGGASRPALLCVERAAGACHRSLLAAEIARQTGVRVEHLGG